MAGQAADAFSIFDGLENLDDLRGGNSAPAPAKALPTFPCMSCAGTGRFRGVRIHQPEERCFACGGRGVHNKPAHERAAAKAKRELGVVKAQAARRAAFETKNPGLRAWMASQDWSSFLQEMVGKIDTPRGLSDGQLAAVLRTQEKCAARKIEKAAAKAAGSIEVSLATVEAMFDKARENGLSKLAYRAHGLVISPANSAGKNPGAIYVKTDGGEYLGKVMGGKFLAVFAATPEHKANLLAIAADPAGEARAYGKRTGKCCCCGRELTDPESIEAGIGPICATNWGF